VTNEKSALDIHDLAEIFGCGAETIKRMSRRGELPAFKFGKFWYVRQNDLASFLTDAVASNRLHRVDRARAQRRAA